MYFYTKFILVICLSIVLLEPYVEFILDYQRGDEIVSILYVQANEEFTARVENGELLNRFDSAVCCAATIEVLGNCSVLYIDGIERWRRYCIYLPKGMKQ